MKPVFKEVTSLSIKNLSITVVYDNNPYKEGLTTSWGFACVIKGSEKTILFDTGGNSAVLLNNMQQLGIDPKEIDVVVLSHIHGDHVGGLNGFLQENINVAVYLPAAFPLGFKESLKRAGIKTVEVNDPSRICKGVYSTGVLGNWIKEQALMISTDRGLIVITGCAHPGIVNILKTVKELNADKILLVMGGFHLGAMGKPQLEKIIVNFRKLGVQQVGPCHCTGDAARQMLKEAYGSHCMNVGVGRLIGFDITKRKRAENALKESKSTIQALLDATLEAALLIDTKGTVLAVNEICAQRMGKSKDGIVGANAYDFFPPDVAKNRAEKIKIVLSSGKPLRFADEHSGRHYYHSLYPVFDSDGIVDKVAIFGQDLTLQHQNELALRDSEEKYRQLFESDSDAVIIFDAETRQFEDANQAALDLYGYAKDEFLTLKVEDISDEKEKTRSHVKKIRDGGAYAKRVPLRYLKKKDGSVFPGEISAGRFTIAGRKKIIGAVRDITERMNAQEDLRKSEARYRALSEATFEAIFISEKGVFVDTNQRATELFGYDYDELINIFGTDVIASESKELVKRNMLSGCEKPYEAIAQKKDGTKFHVEICGKMMKYKDKDVRMAVIRDISEQKRAEEALRESEKRYRNLFNSIPIGLYRTTPEGSILDVNSTMLEILGYPDQNALLQTKSLETYIDPDDRKQFQRLLGEKGFVHDFTVQLRRHDGRSIWVTINATTVHDSNSQMTYYEGAMADISDRKESEERIHKLSQQLIQAQEDERQMISRELHDTVAQELSAAKMECDLIYGELLNDRPLEAQRIKGAVGILQKSILGVRNMAYDLRPPGLEKLGLVETVYRFCEDFTQMWGVPVDFQSAGLKNLKLDYINQINLYRLVQEGLTNIRKHAAASRVTVKLTAAFPNIVLRIEDNGRGFDVQKRAATAGQEKRMGLRSMQERVKLLNGQMKLQSKPGRGTKVSIKLPIVEKKHGTQENHLNR